MTDEQVFEGWYIVEQMGHKRLAGFVREAVIAGAGFLRIDVPGAEGHPAATQFIRPDTIYALTPTTEDLARRLAKSCRPEPVHAYEIREERPALSHSSPRHESSSDYYDPELREDAEF